MRKIIIIEFAIIFLTLVFVFFLVITAHSSYSGYNIITQDNASRALTFDLKSGQTVTGTLTLVKYLTADTGATSYIIYNNDIGEVIVSHTSEYIGRFTFTAKIDGPYYVDIYDENPFGERFNYSYSVSSAIFGIDYTVLIILLITLCVVLLITIVFWDSNLNQQKGKKKR